MSSTSTRTWTNCRPARRDQRTDATTSADIERALTEYIEIAELTPKEERVVAVHEAGHAVVAMHCPQRTAGTESTSSSRPDRSAPASGSGAAPQDAAGFPGQRADARVSLQHAMLPSSCPVTDTGGAAPRRPPPVSDSSTNATPYKARC